MQTPDIVWLHATCLDENVSTTHLWTFYSGDGLLLQIYQLQRAGGLSTAYQSSAHHHKQYIKPVSFHCLFTKSVF